MVTRMVCNKYCLGLCFLWGEAYDWQAEKWTLVVLVVCGFSGDEIEKFEFRIAHEREVPEAMGIFQGTFAPSHGTLIIKPKP